jgi:hypothetical protein
LIGLARGWVVGLGFEVIEVPASRRSQGGELPALCSLLSSSFRRPTAPNRFVALAVSLFVRPVYLGRLSQALHALVDLVRSRASRTLSDILAGFRCPVFAFFSQLRTSSWISHAPMVLTRSHGSRTLPWFSQVSIVLFSHFAVSHSLLDLALSRGSCTLSWLFLSFVLPGFAGLAGLSRPVFAFLTICHRFL